MSFKKKGKKVAKLALATAVATSVITTANPADAASQKEAEKLVKQAEKLAASLQKEVTYECRVKLYPKNKFGLPNAKLYKDTEVALKKAKKEISKLKGNSKKVLGARLAAKVETPYKYATTYIKVVNVAKELDKTNKKLDSSLNKGKIDSSVVKLHTKFTLDVMNFSQSITKVKGTETKKALTNSYAKKFNKTDKSANYAITIQKELAQLDAQLKAGNDDKAKSLKETIKKCLAEGKKLGYINGTLAKSYDASLKKATQDIDKRYTYSAESGDSVNPTVYGGTTDKAKVINHDLVIEAGKDQYIKVANVEVNGNIVIKGNKTGAGTVTFDNVKVNAVNGKGGEIIVEDVADHSFYITNVKADKLSIKDVNGGNIVAKEGTKIKELAVVDKAGETGKINLVSAKGSFDQVGVASTGGKTEVAFNGDFSESKIEVKAPSAQVTIAKDAVIKTMDIKSEAKINVQEGAKVESINLAVEQKGQKVEFSGALKDVKVTIANANVTVEVAKDTVIKEITKDKDVTGDVTITNNGTINTVTDVKVETPSPAPSPSPRRSSGSSSSSSPTSAALLTATVAPGTTIDTTAVTATAATGNMLVYKVSSTVIVNPNVGDSVTGTSTLTSGADITGIDVTTNKYLGVYELDGSNKVVKFKLITVQAGDIKTVPFDQNAANLVTAKITALPSAANLTLANETAVSEAKTAFDGLTPTQKALVDEVNQTKLTEAVSKIAELRDQTAPTPGATGSITTASVSDTSLTLNWTKATDNVTTQANLKYFVYRSTTNNINTLANAEANGTLLNAGGTTDINTFNLTGLTASTTYYFNVVVVDAAGRKAAYTSIAQATGDQTVPTIITTAGTYGPATGNQTIAGNVTIAGAAVTLRNVTIKGNLILDKAIGEGDVRLEGVKVEGQTIVNGGGQHSVYFKDSVLMTVIVNKNNGAVRIVAQGNTQVYEVQLETPAIVKEENLNATATGFEDIVVSEAMQAVTTGDQVQLEGDFETINSRATNIRINLSGETDIRTLVLNAATQILGTGRIETAEINANGSTISQRPQNLVLDINRTVQVENDHLNTSYNDQRVTSTTIDSIIVNQGSISIDMSNFIAGLTIGDFKVTATVGGTAYTLQNLQYNQYQKRITFDPIVSTTGDTVRITVAPSSSTTKVTGEAKIASFTIDTGFSGRITDIQGVGIEGMTIKFREGTGTKEGNVVREATTDRYGNYSVNLPAGTYTGELSGAGYITTYMIGVAPTDTFGKDQNETAIRAAASNEVKIMLSWGENPLDLDSHLLGPGANGTPFHIAYYNNKEINNDITYVDLDWDDTESYGPETTTIRKLVDGDYRFFIHNYSETKSLRNSGAKVEVFKGNVATPTHKFEVPTGEGDELNWLVFDMKISNNGETVEIIPVGTPNGTMSDIEPITNTNTFPITTDKTTTNDVATLGLEGTNVESSDTSVATARINSNTEKIEITSLSAGTATITVTDAANHKATIPVTVNADGSITLGTITKYSDQIASTFEAVNAAGDRTAMATALKNNETLFGINMTDGVYGSMDVSRQPSVANYVLDSRPAGGYTTVAQVKAAFEVGLAYEAAKWEFSKALYTDNLTETNFTNIRAAYVAHAAYRVSIGKVDDTASALAAIDIAKSDLETFIPLLEDQFNDNTAAAGALTNAYRINDVFQFIREQASDEDSLVEGTISFSIQNAQFTDDYASVEIIPYKENGGSNTETSSKVETKLDESGLRINVTDIDETLSDTFYAVINTNGYLFIEKLSKKDIQDGLVKTLTVDENYAPLQVSLPGVDATEKGEHDWLSLNLTNESGKGILTAGVSPGTFVPYGTYNIHYNAARENVTYSLFKDNFTVSNSSKIIEFTKDELALVTLEMIKNNVVNYELDDVAPLYSLGEKYNIITHPRLEEGVNAIYLMKGQYNSINPSYIIEKNQQFWDITFFMNSINIQKDETLKVDDQLRIDVNWHQDEPMDMNTPLYHYMDSSIKNEMGHRVEWFYKVDPDQWGGYSRIGSVNGTVTLKTNEKEYSKKVEGFRFNQLTLNDITNGEEISGQAELSFQVENSPIDIKSYREVITIGDQSIPGEESSNQTAPTYTLADVTTLVSTVPATQGDYTEATWTAVQDAKATAEGLTDQSTQTEINAAYKALDAAIKALDIAPIVAISIQDKTGTVGEKLTADFSSVFTDADNDTLTLSSDKGSITGTNWSFTPDITGTITITITADDGSGGIITDSFDVVVS